MIYFDIILAYTGNNKNNYETKIKEHLNWIIFLE